MSTSTRPLTAPADMADDDLDLPTDDLASETNHARAWWHRTYYREIVDLWVPIKWLYLDG